MTSIRLRVLAQTLPFLLIAPAVALAQTPPSRAEATTALHASANPGAVQFTRQQLDQMLAPIALYPDELLSQILMAATYPQQVLDAAQWLQDPSHKDVKGDSLAQGLEPLPWDPSVKSLIAFPQIIAMMAEHIEWTQALGTAFAEDQVAVMDRIQALRHLAMQSGKLKSVTHLTVREESGEIIITSAEPDRIYVPIYNPLIVYGGDWPDRDYPPVYLPPPQGFVAETIEPGIEISSGFAVVGSLWGWSHPDWREHRITVERDRYTRITRNAQISSDNVWHHSGSVAAVKNLPHRGAASGQVPAGTVAPAAVARRGQAAQTGGATPSHNTASAPGSRPTTGTTNAPERNQATTNRSGRNEAERNRNESGQNPAEHRQGTNAQPRQAPGGNNQPENRSGTSGVQPNTSEPGNAARQNEQPRHEQGEGAGRGPEHRQAPGENEMRREPTPPGSGSSQERQDRAREQEQNRPNAAQTPSPPPAAPPNPQAERHVPPQGAAPAPKQAERPTPPAQGSSTPPAAAPQPPKPGGPPHEQKRGEDEQKNGR